MTTSGSTDWNLTRNEIISEALENIGAYDVGEELLPEDIVTCTRSLNLLLKSLQANPSVALRFKDYQTLSLVAGTGSYDLETGTKHADTVWLRIDSEDVHLDIISEDEYNNILNKSEQNQPQYVYIDYSATLPKAYFNPVPEAVYSCYFSGERRVEDMDNMTDNVDLPVQALDLVIKGLSSKLAPKYGRDINERLFWKGEYTEALREFRSGDTNRTGREIIAPNWVV